MAVARATFFSSSIAPLSRPQTRPPLAALPRPRGALFVSALIGRGCVCWIVQANAASEARSFSICEGSLPISPRSFFKERSSISVPARPFSRARCFSPSRELFCPFLLPFWITRFASEGKGGGGRESERRASAFAAAGGSLRFVTEPFRSRPRSRSRSRRERERERERASAAAAPSLPRAAAA